MGHNSAVKAFLDRHGFSDVNRPRVLDESGTHRIKMEPVYPIEVASALGKEAMVNMLLDAGATSPVRESQSSGGSSCTTSNSKESKGSFLQTFASLYLDPNLGKKKPTRMTPIWGSLMFLRTT